MGITQHERMTGRWPSLHLRAPRLLFQRTKRAELNLMAWGRHCRAFELGSGVDTAQGMGVCGDSGMSGSGRDRWGQDDRELSRTLF